MLRSGRSRSPVARHLKRRIGVVVAAVLEAGVERRRIAGGVLLLSWRLDCWWCVAATCDFWRCVVIKSFGRGCSAVD